MLLKINIFISFLVSFSASFFDENGIKMKSRMIEKGVKNG
jgi:hypothetical protein